MRRVFRGKYVGGILFQGKSGYWWADVSYLRKRKFNTEEEALEWMASVGVFDK